MSALSQNRLLLRRASLTTSSQTTNTSRRATTVSLNLSSSSFSPPSASASPLKAFFSSSCVLARALSHSSPWSFQNIASRPLTATATARSFFTTPKITNTKNSHSHNHSHSHSHNHYSPHTCIHTFSSSLSFMGLRHSAQLARGFTSLGSSPHNIVNSHIIFNNKNNNENSRSSVVSRIGAVRYVQKKKTRVKSNKNYKLKTHQGCKLRFRFKGDGRVFRMPTGGGHKRYIKTRAQRTRLHKPREIPKHYYKMIKKLMPYGKKYNGVGRG